MMLVHRFHLAYVCTIPLTSGVARGGGGGRFPPRNPGKFAKDGDSDVNRLKNLNRLKMSFNRLIIAINRLIAIKYFNRLID